MLARAGRIMEPWFAALARPTAAVPSAAAHNNALAWRTSRAGAVCERASPSSSARCPRRHLQSPSRSHHPTHTTTDHYLSDTPLGSIELGQSLGTGTHWDARRRWLDPLVGPTMCELMHGRQGGNDVAPSLGLVRPARVISVGVRSSEDWSDAQTAMLAPGQPSSQRRASWRRHHTRSSTAWECQEPACQGHVQSIADWEIGEAYRSWRRRGYDAVEEIKRKWLEVLCAEKRDTHLFVGDQHKRPGKFLVLGVFYPERRPEVQAGQLALAA